MQNFSARKDGDEFGGLTAEVIETTYGHYFDRLAKIALPNMQALQTAFRVAGIEGMFTLIESLTKDGRDRSLDYKITGFKVPKGRGTAKCSTPATLSIWLPSCPMPAPPTRKTAMTTLCVPSRVIADRLPPPC